MNKERNSIPRWALVLTIALGPIMALSFCLGRFQFVAVRLPAYPEAWRGALDVAWWAQVALFGVAWVVGIVVAWRGR